MLPFSVVVAFDRTLLSSISRRGPKYRSCKAPKYGPKESAETANTGVVTKDQLDARTVYRPGEVLEATPGLIASHHSGEGKANQFYLRGFNLDHGTDVRTTIDGIPVNERSHAHGQGWTELNFLIPELVNLLEYRKGPFYAAEGDSASAGAVHVTYLNHLAKGVASVGLGQSGYRRTFLANSPKLGDGNLLYALELFHNDSPFTEPDNLIVLDVTHSGASWIRQSPRKWDSWARTRRDDRGRRLS